MVTLCLVSGAVAQTAAPRPPDPARNMMAPSAQFKAPDNIDFRTASITSEGVRLHAELFSLKSLAGKPLPTIIQGHGWGGTATNFRRDALDFASAGYFPAPPITVFTASSANRRSGTRLNGSISI